MTENSNPRTPCRVLRCLTPAAWRLTVTDEGRHVLTGDYCAVHAAMNVADLARAGRRLTFDALTVAAVTR